MKRRFKTLDDIRRYAADVINRLEAGELDDAGAKTRMYCVNVITGVVKDSTLESRIASIEEVLAEKQTGVIDHDTWVIARESAKEEATQ